MCQLIVGKRWFVLNKNTHFSCLKAWKPTGTHHDHSSGPKETSVGRPSWPGKFLSWWSAFVSWVIDPNIGPSKAVDKNYNKGKRNIGTVSTQIIFKKLCDINWLGCLGIWRKFCKLIITKLCDNVDDHHPIYRCYGFFDSLPCCYCCMLNRHFFRLPALLVALVGDFGPW